MLQLAAATFSSILNPFFALPSDGAPFPETYEQFEQTTDYYDRQVALIDSLPLKDLQEEQEKIRRLFFEILPRHDYDRSKITRGSPLESILDQEVFSAHTAPDRIDSVTGRRVQETIAEARFASRLGVKPEKADSEYHVVYYLLNRSGERLGVLKPRMEKPALEDHYGASEDREAHLAEAANSQLDDFLGTHLVPHTEIITCDFPFSPPITGSFQFYVSGAPFLETQLEGDNFFDPDHTALRQRLDTQANRELNIPNFEDFAFFDLLTANNDHHFRNILWKAGLVAIDNGNSFPWCHDRSLPPYKMRPLHWFKWSTLPQAQKPFSQPMIDKLNHLDLDRIEEMLRMSLVSEDVPSSQEHIDGKIKTFRDRSQTIRERANQGASMADIATAILQL